MRRCLLLLVILAAAPASAGKAAHAPVTPPVLYPANQTQSPVSAELVAHWRDIWTAGRGLRPNVFMKVGDSNSILAIQGFLNCFNGSETGPATQGRPWIIDLGGRTHLRPAIEYFRTALIPGGTGSTTPFGRDSLAALVGSKVGDQLIGNPSNLIREVDATLPRFAIIMFGSNDIQGALPTNITPYERDLRTMVDTLIARGVLPILTTMPERQDTAAYARMVPAFNGVVRAVAQGRQIPLLDLNRELWPTPDHGMSGDGVHLSIMGVFDSCRFGQAGLNHGMNVRNLVTMEALNRLKSVLVDNAAPPDANPVRLSGDGSTASPFLASSIPFVDLRDTRASANSSVTSYSCRGSTAARGPEYFYRLDLAQQTAVRAVLLDGGADAVTLNLLSAANGNSCLQSAPRMIATSLKPGTYYFAVDSVTRGGGAEYTLSLTACVTGDTSCDSPPAR